LGAGEEFEEFYGAAFGRLVGQLFLVTGDLHEAEDVVQEAFARAAERWSTIRTSALPRPPGPPGPADDPAWEVADRG
jgi:DNA-directed RNA polymerase specialized sigma24 family protein